LRLVRLPQLESEGAYPAPRPQIQPRRFSGARGAISQHNLSEKRNIGYYTFSLVTTQSEARRAAPRHSCRAKQEGAKALKMLIATPSPVSPPFEIKGLREAETQLPA
jgi:hypothetical protein